MKQFPSRGRDYAFSQALVRLRTTLGLTQAELAEVIGISRKAVSYWEVGKSYPQTSHLQALLTYAMEQEALATGQEEEEIRALWQVAHQKMPLEELWLQKLLLQRSSSSSGEPASPTEPVNALATRTQALWTVPYARNPHFTGRDELIEQLEQQLAPMITGQPSAIRHAALTQAQVIKGLGGIGKTQIAVEYAYRAREQGRYTHVFWITASNIETILASFAALAEVLPGVDSDQESDQHKLVAATIRWLEQCPDPWLLIIDNADDLSLVQPYLPLQGNGCMLLTTRASAVSWLASSISVDAMGLLEGAKLLLCRAQRFSDASDEQINEAIDVAVALAQFPLALDQAGAYIEETGCSLSDYLQLYQTHRYALLSRRGSQATGHPDSVATTWSLSFAHITQSDPAAAELLELCAYLSPDHIPEELLTQGAPYWPPMLQRAVVDRFRFNQMLETLLAFSLVIRLPEQKSLSIHQLVQAVQIERMNEQQHRQWAERVVRAVNAIFPRKLQGERETWQKCQRYLEQAQVSYTLIERYQLLFPEAADLLKRTGLYLQERALYRQAQPLLRRALTIREHLLSDTHPDMASSLIDLANIFTNQGNYTEAEPLYRRAILIGEQTLGPAHANLASWLNSQATFFVKQGQYAAAEQALLRVLRIRDQLQGSEHLSMVSSLQQLASIYLEQGRYAEAEPLFLQAVEIWEAYLGPGHPDMPALQHNLDSLYLRQGKYVEQGRYMEAEPVFLRALGIWEAYLGPGYPDMAALQHNLASLYWRQGKYAEAEAFFQRAIDVLEKYVGPRHPTIAFSLLGLAGVASATGDAARAEHLARLALDIWEEQLGPDHPEIAFALWGLAFFSVQQGRTDQAEALFMRALSLRELHLGEMHVRTAHVLHDFASFLHGQGRDREAAVMYQRALNIREHILGPENPLTLDTRTRLQEVLAALNQRLEHTSRKEESSSHISS